MANSNMGSYVAKCFKGIELSNLQER